MLQKRTVMQKQVLKKTALVSTKPKPVARGLEIQHSEGRVSIYKTSWIIIGPPGIGKSTLASGFEDCLFLVTSEKEVGRLKVPYVLLDSWEKALEITDELLNNRAKYPYKFLVIDFIDAVWTMCAIAVCEKLGVAHYTDAQWGKGSDTLDNYFKKWITALIASDYGVVMISHVQSKDVMIAGGMVTKTICTLPARARMVLFPLTNVIGCLEYKTIKETNAKIGKIELRKRRVINFEGNEYVEAKDRDGVMPTEIILTNDPSANFQLFKRYYDEVRK